MKISFKRILVALERNDSAVQVFEQALTLAKQNDSNLILTSWIKLKTLEQLSLLIDAGCGLVSSAKLRKFQDEHLNEVKESWLWLCDYALQAQAYGINAEVKCETGEARVQICTLVQQWEADLIVVGHGGKPSLKEKLFGNITNQVVLHAPCSVIVVQPESKTQNLSHFKTSKSIREPNKIAQQSMWNLQVPVAYKP
ncbi:UspA domain-containing protein [Stanieria cyanosphaera PCC 7437]|uniref:UspA domain-containing protein n=1 Tax=Stanieria cyanosphaera (strain ATCC 29371 / PCC 7437) TaxID=111780 RepID=K9XUM7_STAC7|nr:universal stress protein [Stanieria cyanosphaera]AFZ36305.1 UspA domain-containing protein [Stanieria cyanosphaera PCC 7437]